jgi:hypothetical protein
LCSVVVCQGRWRSSDSISIQQSECTCYVEGLATARSSTLRPIAFFVVPFVVFVVSFHYVLGGIFFFHFTSRQDKLHPIVYLLCLSVCSMCLVFSFVCIHVSFSSGPRQGGWRDSMQLFQRGFFLFCCLLF